MWLNRCKTYSFHTKGEIAATQGDIRQKIGIKQEELQQLEEDLIAADTAIVNAIDAITKAETERAQTTDKMKELCKESLLFVYHASSMKRVYYAQRRRLAEKANEVLRRVKRARWKLQDVQMMIIAIKKQVMSHEPSQNGAEKQDGQRFVGTTAEAPAVLDFEELDIRPFETRGGFKATAKALLLTSGGKKNVDKPKPKSKRSSKVRSTSSEAEIDISSPTSTPLTSPRQNLKAPIASADESNIPKPSMQERVDPVSEDVLAQHQEPVPSEEVEGEMQQEEETLEEEGEEGSVLTTYSNSLFEDPRILAFLDEARQKIQSTRIPKEPNPSWGMPVNDEERISEQLYEEALQRLFLPERESIRLDKGRNEREEAAKMLSAAAEEVEPETVVDEAFFFYVKAAGSSSAAKPSAPTKTTGPALFNRIWERVRKQKFLLVEMDFVEKDLDTPQESPRLATEAYPDWRVLDKAARTSSGSEDDDDDYSNMWACDASSLAPSRQPPLPSFLSCPCTSG